MSRTERERIKELDVRAYWVGVFGGGPEGHRPLFVARTCDAIMADLDAEAQAHGAQREAALSQIAACAAALHTLSVGVDAAIDEIDTAVATLRKADADADAPAHTEGGAR